MKIILLHLFLLFLILESKAQELNCYCYHDDAPILLSMQKNADNISEWILIKDDSVAILTYMDKNCQQDEMFFEEKFEEEKKNNRLYPLTHVGDSISFIKTFNFIAKDRSMSQDYVYNAKVYADSLKVFITYPKSKSSMSSFYDLTGPPNRTYVKVPKN